MPSSINIHGGTGGKGMESMFSSMLRNPNPEASRAFEKAWRANHPNADLLIPRGRNSLASQLASLNKSLARSNITPSSHRRLIEESRRMSEAMKTFSNLTGAPLGGTIRSMNNQMMTSLNRLGGIKASEHVAMINRLGNGAVGAAMRGDRGELRKIEKTLQRIEKSSEGQLKVLTGAKPGTAQGNEAALHRRGIEAINAVRQKISAANAVIPRGRFSGLSSFVKSPVLGLVAKFISATIGAPMALGGMAAGLLAGSSGYTGMMRELGRVGRYGGANSKKLYNWLAPGGKGNALLAAAGISGPEEAAKVLSAYGMPIRGGGKGALMLLQALGYARNTQGIGGLTPTQRAGLLGQGATLGITGGNLTDYINKLKNAFAGGLNKSEVLKGMESTLQVIANQGGVGVNIRGNTRLMSRLMGSGAPGLRTAAGVASAIGGMGASINSLNTNPVSTAFFLRGVYAQNGGHLPRNMKELTSIFGSGVMGKYMHGAAGKHMLHDLLAAGKSGNAYMFNMLASPLLQGNKSAYAKLLGAGMKGMPYRTLALAKTLFPGLSGASQITAAYGLLYGPHGQHAGHASAANQLKHIMGVTNKLHGVALGGSKYTFDMFATEFAKAVPAMTGFNTEMDKGAKAVDKVTHAMGNLAHQIENGVAKTFNNVIRRLDKAAGIGAPTQP